MKSCPPCLAETGRAPWLDEEIEILLDPETYIIRPEDAWKRIKTRNDSGKFLALLRELAAFRETYAQKRNIPRGRVFKDDALLELAAAKPRSLDDLGRTRLLLREARRGEIAEGILAATAKGLDCAPEDMPKPAPGRENLQVNPALADLLRVLLKAKSDNEGIAAKLIASSADLDGLAGGLRDAAALSGWRAEVFGNDALRLCRGELALAVKGERVDVIAI